MIHTDRSTSTSSLLGFVPDRRRFLWAAVTGSGMLSAIYWTVPPIFSDGAAATTTAAGVVSEAGSPLKTASLVGGDYAKAATLPDIPMTPSIEAHRRSITLLEEGVRQLQNESGYTADFAKIEVVNGALTNEQLMQMKLRHAPFSVYMKWTAGKPGQELLYVDGQNEGSMVVRPSGIKGRLLGAIKLDPYGSLALNESRHPVTEAGLLRLAQIILESRYKEANWLDGYTCVESQTTIDGRPCHTFTIEYDSPKVRHDYRKSVISIDREYLYVAKIENFAWPTEDIAAAELDTETLIESYTYTNVNFDHQLAAIDFTTANREYGLRRR